MGKAYLGTTEIENIPGYNSLVSGGKPMWNAWKLHNFDGDGLDQYFAVMAALDAGGSGIHNVCVLSASDGEGYTVDLETPYNNILNGFVGRLNQKYAARYQDTGEGMLPAQALAFGSSPWQYDANWGWLDGGYAICGNNKYAATAGAVATYTFRGTGLVVTCVRGAATGSFTAKIDGVSKGTFNTYNSPDLIAAYDFIIAPAGSLTEGMHTLEITTSSTAIVMLVGAYALTNATKGFRLIRCCDAGKTVPHFTWTPAAMYAEIDHWNPKLTIIALIANDAALDTVPATYKTLTQTLITRAKGFGDVLLYADYPRPDYPGSINTPYLEKLIELSNENDVPLIDMITPYKDKIASLGYMAADNVHPNAAGHRLLAFPLELMLFP